MSDHGIENTIVTLHSSKEIEDLLYRTKIVVLRKQSCQSKKHILKLIMEHIIDIMLLWLYVQKNRKKYDIINVHNFPANYSVFPFAKNSVWMCNEPPIQLYLTPIKNAFLLFLLRVIDRLIVRSCLRYSCVSDRFNYKRFVKIYGLEPEIINYGVDYAFFSKGNKKRARKMLHLNNKNFVLLQVGTITPLKNQIESVKTVEKLKDKIPNIKLILIGKSDKEYEKLLRQYIQSKKLEKYVIFMEHSPRETIRDINKLCDVAIFPVKSQGGWLAPFEVLCAAKPIVVSRALTCSDIIEKHKLGIVTNDFATAVLNIYNNRKKYQSMANHGKEWVKKNLTWDTFCEKMTNLFKELMCCVA